MVPLLLVVLTFGVLVLASTSAYSSFVASQNHSKNCARTDLILDVFHDVIALALSPQPGQRLTAIQVEQITSFEDKAFARIDEARC